MFSSWPNRTLALAACSGAESDSVVATGTLEVVEVDVAPLAPGRVVLMRVRDGDSVRAWVVGDADLDVDAPVQHVGTDWPL